MGIEGRNKGNGLEDTFPLELFAIILVPYPCSSSRILFNVQYLYSGRTYRWSQTAEHLLHLGSVHFSIRAVSHEPLDSQDEFLKHLKGKQFLQ